jgi:hypothetical protein
LVSFWSLYRKFWVKFFPLFFFFFFSQNRLNTLKFTETWLNGIPLFVTENVSCHV